VINVWKGIVHTSGAKLYSALAGMLFLFLTARYLGPTGRGEIVIITTAVSLFSVLVGLSLGQVAIFRIASKSQKNVLNRLFINLLSIAFGASFFGWLIALLLYLYNSNILFSGLNGTLVAIGFLALPFLIWEQYGSSLLIGLDQVRIYNRYQVIGRSVSIVALILLVSFGIFGALIANLIGQIIVSIAGIRFLYVFIGKNNFISNFSIKEIKTLSLDGVKIHLNAIGSFLFTSANVLILNFYHGVEETAYFQLAIQLITVLTIIPQAAGLIVYGKVSTIGPNMAWPINRKILLQVMIGMVAVIMLSYVASPFAIDLVVGESFLPAVQPFQLLLPSLIGITLSHLMAPQWIGRGYFWQVSGLSIIAGIISVGGNLLLIPKYGIQGAIYTYLGIYTFSILTNGLMAVYCAYMWAKIKRIDNE
jgi:O-antigen/teichoic acid export membrane protein